MVDFNLLRQQATTSALRRLDEKRPIWIFGAGRFGRSLAQVLLACGFFVEGFVETNPQPVDVLGLPVIGWHDVAKSSATAQLVIGIFNRSAPYSDLVALARRAGFVAPLMPWELYDQFGSQLGWRFWLGSRNLLVDNLDRLESIAARLGDDESQEILQRICAFRLGLDLNFSIFRSSEPQYFNGLTLPRLMGKKISYVDCGAYNGDTFMQLVRNPGVSCCQAYLLEPEPANYLKLVNNMTGSLSSPSTKVVCLPLAASDGLDSLTFASGEGEGSAIQIDGDIHITAMALDQLIHRDQINFVKLDVEGAEGSALRGAKRLIQQSRPVLALSLYHKPEDIWELPELLFELCVDYKYFIRQHYFNSFDSVLYAVPC
ncbi:hypothetical protein CCAE64S_02341 [Castellaniella caeni]